MSGSELPAFVYHPDPVATGSVERSDGVCVVCGRARGWIYRGPVYAEEELHDSFCPWCIADGDAARLHGATFADEWAAPDDVPGRAIEEIKARTPGFETWQTCHWLYHCGDGAAFLGRAGRAELQGHPDALDMLRHEHDELALSSDEVERYLESLDAEGEPTAYLFRCRHCSVHLAYSDFS